MKNFLLVLLACCGFIFAQSQVATAPGGGLSEGIGMGAPVFSGVRTPLVVGGALGFGSGTGVGSERGIGLRQIEPMVGLWYPGLGFFRVGYGMFGYKEESEGKEKYEVDHSEMDFELGLQLLGDIYLMGNYSRVKELSDLGDVAWNEWGAGVGSMLYIFSRTMIFAEVGYRWVLNHYDPFMDKKVDGGRLQLNLGFAAFVY